MSRTIQKEPEKTQVSTEASERPKCLEIAQKGIVTAGDFATFMSRLISDVIEGSITPQVTNAAVNAGGKLLKVVEMQYKYGKMTPDGNVKALDLIGNGA